MATIEGRNPVIEAIKNDREIDKIMIANSAKEGSIKKIIGMAKEKNIVIQYVDKHKLDEISTSHSHQGVIAQVSEYKYWELDELIESVKAKNEDPFFIILDEITDPHNLGSIIRTADAVGAHGVIIPKRRSVHITPIVAKASAGAVEYVPVCKVTNIVNTIKKLKDEAYIIEKQTATDKRVKALYSTDKGTKLVRELNKKQNDMFQDIQKKVGNDWYAIMEELASYRTGFQEVKYLKDDFNK